MPSNKKNLDRARKVKNDEFYTRYEDIEKELRHYEKQFKDKKVYCNCDDLHSNFVKYFKDNFERLGLKSLVSCGYNKEGKGEYFYFTPNREYSIKDFNADFRGMESLMILKQADIVVTNPPFSLFREYVAQLMEYKKKFLIIGNMNSIACREIFKLIKKNLMWWGVNGVSKFISDTNSIKNSCARWYTNLHHGVINNQIELYKKYNENEYPMYDIYNAINVDKVKYIPIDYDGAMGVPISFMDKYNPEQFEIIDAISRHSLLTGSTKDTRGLYLAKINGNRTYARIIIKKK